MRYAMIIAGGSGTRLWPMSRAARPKQLIPFIGGQKTGERKRSLLEIAFERLEGLLPTEQRYVCAGQSHKEAICHALPGLGRTQFLAEPCGRDTLNAVGFGAAVLRERDPDAVIAIFTADHIIEPVDEFLKIIDAGFSLVESQPKTLVTFGISPTAPAVGYGYLELGESVAGTARRVLQFREKPDLETAKKYFAAGPEKYLWNSGMFVWRADTLLDCIRRWHPENYDGLTRIGKATTSKNHQAVIDEVYPTLKKISVDYAVMEPASRDATVSVAAVPMPLRWLDVGSWPSMAETCPHDENRNAAGAQKTLFMDTRNTLAASDDPNHLIATIGCDDLVIIHTSNATLVCRADCADKIKEMQRQVSEQFGKDWV